MVELPARVLAVLTENAGLSSLSGVVTGPQGLSSVSLTHHYGFHT